MNRPCPGREARTGAESAASWPGQANAGGKSPPRPIREWIAQAGRLLESRLESDLLACFVLGKSRSWLYAHDDQYFQGPFLQKFVGLVDQRRHGVPLAYLVGRREFYGRDFEVGDAVLIPRPETEHLVEFALSQELPDRAVVADIGTGSGCIVLTLAAERPAWRCTAVDISPEALEVAERNRQRLGLADVELIVGDLLDPLSGRAFDLIVSNPPYVAASDPHLERGDVRFEPAIALTPGADGLASIRSLVASAPGILRPGGVLAVEHGHDQAEAVRELFAQQGFEQVGSMRDLAGIERITGGRRPRSDALPGRRPKSGPAADR